MKDLARQVNFRSKKQQHCEAYNDSYSLWIDCGCIVIMYTLSFGAYMLMHTMGGKEQCYLKGWQSSKVWQELAKLPQQFSQLQLYILPVQERLLEKNLQSDVFLLSEKAIYQPQAESSDQHSSSERQILLFVLFFLTFFSAKWTRCF